ncbi:sulfotransferase family protein [Tabrizicola sp. J26]|uniref:sulfotransferase family 2 domain-containing protein n=1 Tax=Alitabrizicola rongguiensis TaxID=2909234 RepID=UPI001F451CDF|nr:sulfotransferase family 2 domain-containing protein [Tabrizicola rongguiensis]MCF1709039.1 sulfotransferase family protein [Tabrizicola rongguiensis]
MIILGRQRLVFLEMPKAASTSIARMMKRGFADEVIVRDKADRHIGIVGFRRKIEEPLSLALGGPIETFAVVRDPIDRAWSWYRYRHREKVRGLPVDTSGMTFEQFLAGCLIRPVPAHARTGSQARFVGFADGRAEVDYLFDFANLKGLKMFLSRRAHTGLHLPRRNASPAEPLPEVPAALSEALRQHWAEDFALYDTVRAAGCLRRAN